MTDEPASITHFRHEHKRLGGRGTVTILPDAAHTAALAAHALGCEVGAIANSLLFRGVSETDAGPITEPVLILTSGAHRVDQAAVAVRIGMDSLERGEPDFVRAATGQVIGGVSPIGHPAPVRTWIDEWLVRHPTIWAAAGHASAVYSTTFDELSAMTGAPSISVER